MASAMLPRDQEVGDDRDDRQHGQRDAGLGDDVVDGQRPRDAGLPLVGVLRHIGLSVYLLRTVAGGSGTELRITTLRLGQGSKYRVAGLPHRRFLSCALVRRVAEHTLNDLVTWIRFPKKPPRSFTGNSTRGCASDEGDVLHCITVGENEDVLVTVDRGIGLITLNRPKAINSLTHPMVTAISQVLTDWARDDAIRAVVLSGAGERGLCAGGDIVDVYNSARGDQQRGQHVLVGRVPAQRVHRAVPEAVCLVDGRHRDGRRRRRQRTRQRPRRHRHHEDGDARGGYRVHPRRRRHLHPVACARAARPSRGADGRAVRRRRRHRHGLRRSLRSARQARRVHRRDRRRRHRRRPGRSCGRAASEPAAGAA